MARKATTPDVKIKKEEDKIKEFEAQLKPIQKLIEVSLKKIEMIKKADREHLIQRKEAEILRLQKELENLKA